MRTIIITVAACALLVGLVAATTGIHDGDQRPAMTAPDVLRIPIVKPHPPSDPPDAARFSHWAHDDFQCYNCHMSIFPMAPLGFTHDDMRAGRYCGSCHDGRRAWSPDDKGVDCETCHVPTGPQREDIDTDDLFD